MMGVFVQVNEHSPKGKINPIGYVIQENGCWQWVGNIDKDGYGRWGTNMSAHRRMYCLAKGAIPEGLEMDHLCRNRGCVNPDHLEPVTPKENTLRGEGGWFKNLHKTHCPMGHEYASENTYVRTDKIGVRRRMCRNCMRAATERFVARRRALA